MVFSLYCSRAQVLKVQRGAYKLVKQCRTRGSPTLSYVGGFSFVSLLVWILSLREMGDYKTTRLLVCCALDRIWSSTQRLEDLDWFGPEMPYVQYEGGVLALLLSSPSAQSSEGSLQAFQEVCYLGVESLGVQPFPM